ncbi:MAG TPA: hypothetical protein VKP11_07055, partial [Frankiaceae bacterium]|nr:hypothetical protein [Frankiaceae bacterium]
PPAPAPPAAVPSLGAQVAAHRGEFDAALDRRDVPAAVRAILALEEALHAWSSDTLQSADADQGRAALRTMVVRLGELAVAGARDPRELLRPFVDELVALRAAARADRRYAESDRLRDRLAALGVELRDTPGGIEWRLAS